MAEEATHQYRLKVKIGDSEFEAEGPESIVKEQYRWFLDAMGSVPTQRKNEGSKQ